MAVHHNMYIKFTVFVSNPGLKCILENVYHIYDFYVPYTKKMIVTNCLVHVHCIINMART